MAETAADTSDTADRLDAVVESLAHHLRRMPTEDEVYNFVFGTVAERNAVWALGDSKNE